jgi:glycine dehydrogenase subunit 1
MGQQGLQQIANTCLQKAHYTAQRIAAIPGYSLAYGSPFFHEFVVKAPRSAAQVNRALWDKGIISGLDLATVDAAKADQLLLCVTEKRTKAEIDELVSVLEGLK